MNASEILRLGTLQPSLFEMPNAPSTDSWSSSVEMSVDFLSPRVNAKVCMETLKEVKGWFDHRHNEGGYIFKQGLKQPKCLDFGARTTGLTTHSLHKVIRVHLQERVNFTSLPNMAGLEHSVKCRHDEVPKRA